MRLSFQCVQSMPFHEPKSHRSRQILVLLSCLVTIGYFCVHAIKGRHGLESRLGLMAREVDLRRELAALETVRLELARDVARIGNDDLALDDIDIAARQTLGFAHPSDLILLDGRAPAAKNGR